MWVLDPPGGYPGKTRFFRETLGESGRAGPRICVFGHPGSASLPETGAKRRGATHGCCRGTMWGTLQGRWVSWENSFFRETGGYKCWGGGC